VVGLTNHRANRVRCWRLTGARVVRVMAVSTKSDELRRRNVSLLCLFNYADHHRRTAVTRMLAEPTAIGTHSASLPSVQ